MKKNFLVATRMKILFVTRISGNKSFIFFFGLTLHRVVMPLWNLSAWNLTGTMKTWYNTLFFALFTTYTA